MSLTNFIVPDDVREQLEADTTVARFARASLAAGGAGAVHRGIASFTQFDIPPNAVPLAGLAWATQKET